MNDRGGYGAKPYSASTLANMFDEEIRAFLMYVGVERYLDNLGIRLARARDLAHLHHGRHRARHLQQLRRDLLTTGLDLSTVSRDTAALWSERSQAWSGIEVVAKPAPGLPASLSIKEFDVVDELNIARKRKVKDLLAEESAYREILVTVASLGSSVETSRLGRRALWVAAASLAVAVVTLLVANSGDQTLWSQFLSWMRK